MTSVWRKTETQEGFGYDAAETKQQSPLKKGNLDTFGF